MDFELSHHSSSAVTTEFEWHPNGDIVAHHESRSPTIPSTPSCPAVIPPSPHPSPHAINIAVTFSPSSIISSTPQNLPHDNFSFTHLNSQNGHFQKSDDNNKEAKSQIDHIDPSLLFKSAS